MTARVSIRLSDGSIAQVSPEDSHLANVKWQSQKGRWGTYAIRTVIREGKRVTLSLHREVMKPPAGLEVDHINHDTLDCSRENLRLATSQQNNFNRRPTAGIYKGVHPCGDKCFAQIGFNGKQRRLGTFKTEISAALAYDKAARELFGEFALTNFAQ